MKTIYVSTDGYRSYATQPIDGWPTIPVEVPDDFSGGAKTYDPEKQEWVDDAPIPVDYVAAAQEERGQLLSYATSVTADWRTDLQLDIIDESDREKLIAWQQYIKAVKETDVSKAPDVTWPEMPSES